MVQVMISLEFGAEMGSTVWARRGTEERGFVGALVLASSPSREEFPGFLVLEATVGGLICSSHVSNPLNSLVAAAGLLE